jgi:hypothetical protein
MRIGSPDREDCAAAGVAAASAICSTASRAQRLDRQNIGALDDASSRPGRVVTGADYK